MQNLKGRRLKKVIGYKTTRKLLVVLSGGFMITISLAFLPGFSDAQTSHPEKYICVFTVAKDGSGEFATVQEAINAVPDFRNETTIIFIRKGVYKEKLILPATKTNVRMTGESAGDVILTYDDYASKPNCFGEHIGTSGSASFFIHGEGFTAENITFENSAGPVGQAVAVRVASDKVKFINCKFLGFQDTLYTWGYGAASRQYYKDCYIEGTVDFIFGSSTAVFDHCHIYAKKAGYLTAASTPDTSKFGYVFLKCKIDGDAPAESFYLGRPWRPYAKTVFIDCEMGEIIKPEGWNNWGKTSNEKTVFYAEYRSKGRGANESGRVKWSRQLTDQQVQEYSIENILNGWNVNEQASYKNSVQVISFLSHAKRPVVTERK